ncbi:hypothetical protein [Legionella sp. W05-934-2]|jgi:shikimate kinase|uniref:hypothetical protein n=1 Tax=Legionella sp. W05-934-2 TaxID=1198649 RepID=UPI0034631476
MIHSEMEDATITAPTTHAREVSALTNDAVAAAQAGEYKHAAINAAGAIANIFAFFGSGVNEASKSGLTKNTFLPMALPAR